MVDYTVSPVCQFCGRHFADLTLERANLLNQAGVWACTDHARSPLPPTVSTPPLPPVPPDLTLDGWQNWPHTQAPFDLGYPDSPTIN